MKKTVKSLLAVVLSGMIMISNAAFTVSAAAAETDFYQPSSSAEYLSQRFTVDLERFQFRTFGNINNYYNSYNTPIEFNTFEYAIIPEDIELGTEDNSIIVPAGTIAITGVNTRKYGVAIPSEINGRKVTVIDSQAFSSQSYYDSQISTVSLPNTIIAIASKAFYNTSLSYISIPSSVRFIGDEAFCGCSSLHEIALPDSVSVFGSDVFKGTDVEISAWKKSAAAAYAKANNLYLTCFKESDFEYCENYSYENGYRYNDGTVSVVSYRGDSQTVIIPRTLNGKLVTSIGTSDDTAYSSGGMSWVRTLVIPDSVSEINNIRFSHELCSVSLPESLVSINSSAFSCSLLSAVNLPSALTHIADEAFAYTQLQEIIIPDSVISIGNRAFYNCSNLKQVYLPEGVTVGEEAFSDCQNLNAAVINNSVIFEENSFSARTIIGCSGSTAEEYAQQNSINFLDLNELLFGFSNRGDSIAITNYLGVDEVVTIPEEIDGFPVTAIESGIFNNDYGYYYRSPDFLVSSVTIPNSVETVSNSAFYENYRLTICAHGDAPFISTSSIFHYNTLVDLDNIEYRAEQNTAVITKYNTPDTTASGSSYYYSYNNFVSFPKVIDGKKIVAIDELAFANISNIAEFILPNTINAIGKNAFSNCSNLRDVCLPNSVSVIGEGAFSECRSLLLVTPYFHEIKEVWSIYNNDEHYRIVIPNSVSTLCPHAFYMCDRITSVVIPSSLYEIGRGAFSNCSSLRNVNIPDSIYTIRAEAFSGCFSLSSVTIPKSVNYIEYSAFPNNSSFVIRGYTGTAAEQYAQSSITTFEALNDSEYEYELNEDNTVTINGFVSPQDNNYSSNLDIPEAINDITVTKIGNYAFAENNRIDSVTIPSTVTEIGDSAFEDCTNLSNIEIPDSVTTIGAAAFKNCNDLTNITLPAQLSAISSEMFSNCSQLTGIVIPNTVISIGRSAFSSCSSLTTVTLPSSLKSLDSDVFFNCRKLQNITIPADVTSIGSGAFSYCSSLQSIVIPDGVTSIGSSAFDSCSSLTTVTLPSSLKSLDSYVFSSCGKLQNITIPADVTSIGSGAFDYCGSLQSIVIPNGVTSIGSRAFYYCKSLQTITVPDSVTSIGSSAFCDCSALTSIHIPKKIKTIDWWVFEDCKSLQSVTIPESVTKISLGSFRDCTSLTSVTIPKTVTSIDSSAFTGCTNLTISGYKSSAAETYASDQNIPFVTIPEEPLKNTSSVKSASIVLGDTINITCAASGGTEPYTYSYYFKKSSQSVWTAKSENTSSTSATVKPGSAVEYSVKVVVTDKDGSTDEKIMKINVNPVLTNQSTVASQSITLGDTINVTGSASGGTAPYTFSYYFKQASQSSWTTKLANTSSTSVTIKPGSAVDYNVKVTAKDSTGKTADKTFTINVNKATVFENISTVAAETIVLGNTINITGAARGGTAPYTYSYYFKKASNSSWTTKTANTSSTSVTIKPGAAVNYNVKIAAKDKNGTEAEKIFTVKVINENDLLNNSSVASTSITLGDTINITGAASGGTAPYKYSYYFKKASQSAWTTKLANSESTSTTVKPGSAVDYNIKVVVTDNSGKTAEKTFTIKVIAPLTNQSSVASSSISLGSTINVTGAASGGTAPYKYSYYFKKSSQSTWTTKTANTTSTSVTIKPGSAVEYKVKVTVTDNNGNTSDKVFTVSVK